MLVIKWRAFLRVVDHTGKLNIESGQSKVDRAVSCSMLKLGDEAAF
jgi:hypothetical protein